MNNEYWMLDIWISFLLKHIHESVFINFFVVRKIIKLSFYECFKDWSNLLIFRFITDSTKGGVGFSAIYSADCPDIVAGTGAIASSRDTTFGSVVSFTCPAGQVFATGKKYFLKSKLCFYKNIFLSTVEFFCRCAWYSYPLFDRRILGSRIYSCLSNCLLWTGSTDR